MCAKNDDDDGCPDLNNDSPLIDNKKKVYCCANGPVSN
jgi:hypothetical protein